MEEFKSEQALLKMAKRIQALAQNGLHYCQDEFDKERYEELQTIAYELMAQVSGEPSHDFRRIFKNEEGYNTPKTDVRALVVKEGRILMVREKADGKWSLPGGWADVNSSPREVARKEVLEETGLKVSVKRLLALFDKQHHDHPPSPFHVYKLFFECEISGGRLLEQSLETGSIQFFSPIKLPELSEERITEKQIGIALKVKRDLNAPTYFD